MNYYKVTNKDSKLYTKLKHLLEWEQENRRLFIFTTPNLEQTRFGLIYIFLGIDIPEGPFKMPGAGFGEKEEIIISIDTELNHGDVEKLTQTEIRKAAK